MKVKFLKSGTPYGLGYLAGQTGDISTWLKSHKATEKKTAKQVADAALALLKKNGVIEEIK